MSNAPRPRRFDEAIILAAVEALAPSLIEWAKDSDPDDVKSDLIKAVRSSISCEPYEIAKYLDDRCYWSPDSDLLDILDGLDLYGPHTAAVKAWVAANNIKPQFEIGTRVSTPWGIGPIDRLDEPQGRYLVIIEGKDDQVVGYAATYCDYEKADLAHQEEHA